MPPREWDAGAPRAFGAMLQELRAEGCGVLVTNDLDVGISQATARIVLGSPDRERYRLLAFEEQQDAARVAGFLPAGASIEDEAVHVVTNGSPARSAAKPAVQASLGPDGTGMQPRPDLEPFAHEITEALADLGERFGPFQPGALRVAAFDLSTLAKLYGIHAVRRFCRIVAAHVRGLRGMAYFFLGAEMDDRLVGYLDHLVDARIDVRRQPEPQQYEQRWHVYDLDYTSPWFELEVPE